MQSSQLLGLRPSENSLISSDAFNVWEKFFDRSDIKKDVIGKNDNRYIDDHEEDLDLDNKEEADFVKKLNTIYYFQPTIAIKELINNSKKAIQQHEIDSDEVQEKAYDMWNLVYFNR